MMIMNGIGFGDWWVNLIKNFMISDVVMLGK